ncbi:ATP-binding protein [Staphylococcus aureus]
MVWHVDDHIVVAVSTGIDSMCLLYQLLNDYKDSYRKLTCLHVNHGVRSASIEEARFFRSILRTSSHRFTYQKVRFVA